MHSLFDYDNGIFRFMGRIADYILANLLWLICCIPVVTIGPSTAALYYVMFKITRGEDTGIFNMFFHSFKNNLKQGCVMTTIYVLLLFFFLYDLDSCIGAMGDGGNSFLNFLHTALWILIGLWVVIVSYSFPLLSQFTNSIPQNITNSFFLAMSHIPSTLLIVTLNTFPFLLFYFIPTAFAVLTPLWILGAFSLTAQINAFVLNRMFKKMGVFEVS